MSRVEIPMLAIQALDDKYAGNKFVYELSKLNTAARADPEIKKLDTLNRPPKSGNHEVFYETFNEIKSERERSSETGVPIGGFMETIASATKIWDTLYPDYKFEKFSNFMDNTKAFVASAAFPKLIHDFFENPQRTILANITDTVAIKTLHFTLNLFGKDLKYIFDKGTILAPTSLGDAMSDRTVIDVMFQSKNGTDQAIPLNLSQTYTIISDKGNYCHRVVGLIQNKNGVHKFMVEDLIGNAFEVDDANQMVLLLTKRMQRVISLMRSTYNFTSGYLNTSTSLLVTGKDGNFEVNPENRLIELYTNATKKEQSTTFATVQTGVLAVLQEPECWGIIVRQAEDLVFNSISIKGGEILQAIGSMERHGRMRKYQKKKMYYNTSSDDSDDGPSEESSSDNDDYSSEDESSDEESLSDLGFTQLSIL